MRKDNADRKRLKHFYVEKRQNLLSMGLPEATVSGRSSDGRAET